jgi:hypothetical protein
MPDIRPALGYIGKVRRLEANYIKGINEARLGYKRSVLDILIRDGVRLSTVSRVRSEIGILERAVANVSREQLPKVDELTLWYMNQQLGNLRKIGERGLPTIQELNLATYAERQQVYQNTLSETPAWINDLAHNMDYNLTRLAVSGADVDTAVSRLLALNITDGRASVFRLSGAAAQTQTSAVTWTASVLAASGLFKATQIITRTVYMKQAIAVIDQATTDCCLRVHGQVQPLDKPFILVGTPRFADKLDSPPFHWNCRSATSLYTEKMEEKGIPTSEMVDAAQAELSARERTGKREPIWPAHSTSGRGK